MNKQLIESVGVNGITLDLDIMEVHRLRTAILSIDVKKQHPKFGRMLPTDDDGRVDKIIADNARRWEEMPFTEKLHYYTGKITSTEIEAMSKELELILNFILKITDGFAGTQDVEDELTNLNPKPKVIGHIDLNK